MNTGDFRVSVIIPVYNAGQFVSKSVGSASNLEAVEEVLLIEDGSSDNSLAICHDLCREYEKVKLLWHANGENKGAGASRNLGLEKAKSGFIAFLDADDYFLPDRFEETKVAFENYPEADGVYEAIGAEFESEQVRKEYEEAGLPLITSVKRDDIPPGELFESMILGNGNVVYFSLDGLTLKRNSLKKMDRWFVENLRLHQDNEFIKRLAYYCQLRPGSLDKPVAIRRVHDSNRITDTLTDKRKRAYHGQRLYAALGAWAEREDLSDDVKSVFKGLEVHTGILTKSSIQTWWIVVSHAIRKVDIFRHDRVRYKLLKTAGSKSQLDKWLARVFEFVLMKYLGKNR